MIENSHFSYAARLRALAPEARTWLDLGCGHDFLPSWMPDARRRVPFLGRAVGIDVDTQALRRHTGLRYRIHGNIERLPFQNDTFDLVTANTVLEHVSDPAALFGEVRRVLTPRGRFLIHTPNLRGYTTTLARLVPASLRPRVAALMHGREPEDVYPTHYRMNTRTRLRRSAAEHGFAVDELRCINTSPQLEASAPLLHCELALIRLLSYPAFEPLRPCIVAVFRKRADVE